MLFFPLIVPATAVVFFKMGPMFIGFGVLSLILDLLFPDKFEEERIRKLAVRVAQSQLKEGETLSVIPEADKPVRGRELAIASIIIGILALLGVFTIFTGLISVVLAVQSSQFNRSTERGTYLSKIGAVIGTLALIWGAVWAYVVMSGFPVEKYFGDYLSWLIN